jgi:leucyl/phenylalanyl-tRNA--protein transferase
VLIAPLAALAVSDRSLRCSPGSRPFVESDETTLSEGQLVLGGFRRILLQIGGANIASADRASQRPTSPSLGDEKHVPSVLLSTAARDPYLYARSARIVAAGNSCPWAWWEYADVGSPFGSPELWRHDDLIGVSRVFNEDLALAAYEVGAFPMPAQPGLMGWYSPLERAILPLDGLRVSHSLRKSVRHYDIRTDTAFDDVLDGCADRRRPSGWINRDIRRVYRRLYKRGVVHTVESWTPGGELAGGLYGVSIGGLFAGESMFYRPGIGRDASKVALVALVDVLRRAGAEDRLLDVQWLTPHLESLGAIALPREEYLSRLAAALRLPAPDWSAGLPP